MNPKITFEKISVSDCRGEKFKKIVRQYSCFGSKNHLDFSLSKTLDIWQSIKWNYKKLICLIGKNELDYQLVLEKQIELKNTEKKILVLSTFVLMIVDYNPGILHIIEREYGL